MNNGSSSPLGQQPAGCNVDSSLAAAVGEADDIMCSVSQYVMGRGAVGAHEGALVVRSPGERGCHAQGPYVKHDTRGALGIHPVEYQDGEQPLCIWTPRS